MNRAIGEVRTAREQTTALAVGRAHARTVGDADSADQARGIAARSHVRAMGFAGEVSSARPVTRIHTRPVGQVLTFDAARSVFDRPVVSQEAWVAAIESADRTPIMQLRADWARDGQYGHALSNLTPLVESVTVDREIATALPATVGLVEGTSASTLSAVLSGEWPGMRRPTRSPIQFVGVVGGSATTTEIAPSTTQTATSATFTPAVGELLVVKASGRNTPTSLPTAVSGGGLTWTARVNYPDPLAAPAVIWTATATAATPMAITVTFTSTTTNSSIGVGVFTVERWANAMLAGSPSTTTVKDSTAPYTATISVVDSQSIVTWMDADWWGTAGAPVLGDTSRLTQTHVTAGQIALHTVYDTGFDTGQWTLRVSGPTGQGATVAGLELLPAVRVAPEEGPVSPTWAFAPYDPDAVFYRKPIVGTGVQLDTGFVTEDGERVERRFTGSVRRITASSEARRVRFDAMDGANGMRTPITLAANGLDSLILRRRGEAAYFARINSQWLIDHILRRNGIYASPPLVSNAVKVAATLHGSTIPEVGFGGSPVEYATGSPLTTQAWISDGHPQGMLYPNPLAPTMLGRWYCDEAFEIKPYPHYLSILARVKVPPTNAARAGLIGVLVQGGDEFQIRIETGGRLAAGYFRPSTGVTYWAWVPADSLPVGAWVTFHATLQWAAGSSSMTMGCSTAGYPAASSVSFVPFAPGGETAFRGEVAYQLATPMTNVQISQGETTTGAPVVSTFNQWVPQAVIDKGANEWWGIPTIDNEDSWDLLREVVAAEYGYAGFSPGGTFVFRSRAVDHARGERQQITSSKSLASLTTTVDEAAVRNVISGASARYLIGDWEDIYTSQVVSEFAVGAGVTIFDIPLPDGVCVTPTRWVYFLSEENWRTGSDLWRYRDAIRVAVVNDANPTVWVDPAPFLQMRARIIRPGVLRVRLTHNGNGATVRFATADTVNQDGEVTPGEPAFKLPGRLLKPDPTVTTTIRDEGSVEVYGERSYDLGGQSRWRQHPPAVAALAGSVLGSTGQPTPVLEDIEVPHDPRRDLFTDVELVDPDGLGSVLGTITAIRTTYSSSGAKDVLTVRPLGPPGVGILDDPDLGKVGDTLVFAA